VKPQPQRVAKICESAQHFARAARIGKMPGSFQFANPGDLTGDAPLSLLEMLRRLFWHRCFQRVSNRTAEPLQIP